MRLDELHHDADQVRRSGMLPDAPFDAANSGHTTFDQELIDGGDGVTLDPLSAPGVQEGTPWVKGGWGPQRPSAAPAPGNDTAAAVPDLVAEVDAAEELPLPPPPLAEARAGRRWALPGLVEALARRARSASPATPAADGAAGATLQAGMRRQINPAPILAMGLLGIVLLAVVAGILNAGRVEDEAARTIDAKRKAAERAVGLLGGQAGGTAPPVPPEAEMQSQEPAPRLPGDGRDRHEAMLSAIKSGAVLASLPPTALAQPTPLPADLPPATVTSAANSARASAVPATALLPPKKVALVVEGAAAARATATLVVDPLAHATVSAGLKGSTVPLHRVYQLRESDGEWLGYIARADADPLAAGVWAGSGDLLGGGWRVAEVNSQRLTLVGPSGALEILRP